MAESVVVTPVIEKCVDLVFTQTYKELQYFWKFKSNIESLNTSMTSLESRRENVRLLMAAAKSNAEVISPDVEKWMKEVEEMKNEVDEIIRASRNCQVGCLFNCNCPNIKVRYSLSKKATVKTVDIDKLLGKGQFTQVGYLAPISQRPLTASPRDVFDFQSRLKVEKDVMIALMDENIPVVAVCGMGGVGKTTMVKKIADEIKKENHFNEVVMAVVSQNYDLIHVQQQLAEKLGLKIEQTTLDARANRLHTRFMDQEKRILIILDDLWKEIDLCAIGIPSEVERKGLKVILTSRDPRVCSRMYVDTIINVQELIEEEAWCLFKKHANISDHDSDVLLQGYPKKVAKKCQGLPLAIEVIGKILKDKKELPEWRDILLQLEKPQASDTFGDIYDKVYSLIELSVNYIGSQHKSVLILCSLFPEDYEIEVENLVRYTKGLKLFTGVESMAKTRDRVESIVNDLKKCYLLIACAHHCVKLHDVVRDTCLRIASKGDNVYLVSHSGLRDWPDKDTLESHTKISLAFDDNLKDELPSELNCSMLQLLRLSFRRDESENILRSILQAANNLRVVNIINGNFRFYGSRLPSQSLQTSKSLRTLNLDGCSLYGDLSSLLGSVANVEVLSFYESHYKGKWPEEIGELRKLRSLDLRFKEGPDESLPTGILTKLKSLEEIYLGDAVNMRQPESGEIIKEMGALQYLNTLEILECDFDGLVRLVENLIVERFLRFYISTDIINSPYQFSTTMIIDGTNMGMLSNPKMKAWLSKVDGSLSFNKVTGGEYDLVKDFDGGTVFSRLRTLGLYECEMKYIFNTINSDTKGEIFVELKSLFIAGAEQLEEIWHGDIPAGSFARLETLYLKMVPRLSSLWRLIKPPSFGNLITLEIDGADIIKSLFLRSSVKCFTRLRNIRISNCPNLESLVSWDEQIEQEIVQDEVQFLALEELRLIGLYRFETLCSKPKASIVHMCSTYSDISSFPKLRILEISGSQHLHVGDVIKNGQNLSSLVMSHCSFEVCFDFEGEVPESLFPNLDSLTLRSLPNLRHIWKTLPEGVVAFQYLTTLDVTHCESLEQLFSPHTAEMLVNLTTLYILHCGGLKHLIYPHVGNVLVSLKTLNIRYCNKLEAILGPEEMGASEEISASNHLVLQEGTTTFQNLTTLYISDCPQLKHLLTQSTEKFLASLKRLDIIECDEFEAIIGLDKTSRSKKVSASTTESTFNQLEHLELSDLPRLRNFQRMLPEGTVVFQKLSTLIISGIGDSRYLLTPPMVKMLKSLKEVEIYLCDKMEWIIGTEDVDEATTNEVIELPELCRLTLSNLPELRMLSSLSAHLSLPSWNHFSIESCPRMHKFSVGELSAPKLKKVFLNIDEFEEVEYSFEIDRNSMEECFKDRELLKRCLNCSAYNHHLSQRSSINKVHLCSTNSNISDQPHVKDVIKNGKHLSSLAVSACPLEDVCFDFKGWCKEITGEVPESLFPNLDNLALKSLPKLIHLWRILSEGIFEFQNLSILTISKCRDLRYLLTPSMVKMFKNLKEVYIDSCEKMESIIGTEEADETVTNEVIELPKLCKLKLCQLPELRMLSSHSANFSLPSLNDFSIEECIRMHRFCVGELSAPKLEEVLIIQVGFSREVIDRNNMEKRFKDCELFKLCLGCARIRRKTCDHLSQSSINQ